MQRGVPPLTVGRFCGLLDGIRRHEWLYTVTGGYRLAAFPQPHFPDPSIPRGLFFTDRNTSSGRDRVTDDSILCVVEPDAKNVNRKLIHFTLAHGEPSQELIQSVADQGLWKVSASGAEWIWSGRSQPKNPFSSLPGGTLPG